MMKQIFVFKAVQLNHLSSLQMYAALRHCNAKIDKKGMSTVFLNQRLKHMLFW